MKISTKGRYGLRAMVDLAANSNNDYVSIKSISERQGISDNYLEQVFSSLRKSGLVKSIKGSQGGYMLVNNPSEITVGQIIKAMEGNIDIVDSCDNGIDDKNKTEQVIMSNVWNKINEEINSIVNSITLNTLVEEYKKLQGNEHLMYYI